MAAKLPPEVATLIGAAVRVVVYSRNHGNTREVPAQLLQDLGRAVTVFPSPPYEVAAAVPWCAPGDRQEDVWLIRFDDNDRSDAVYTGPDAETEARAAWTRHCGPSGTWNGYLFRLVRQEG